jgi:hypothetical protein
MSELHKHIAGHEYPCGIVSAVCFYEGSAKAALYARQMGLPFLAALYSVRNAYR